jgi:hypothetical protein
MKILPLMIAMCVTPGYCLADCGDILRYINYNTVYQFNQLTTDQINEVSFCSEQYKDDQSAKSVQIQAAYELFSGHAAASATDIHQEQDKACGGKYGKDFLASLNIQQTQVVSDEAISALKSCYDASAFHLTRLTALGPTFSADFKYGGVGTIKFNGVIIGGGKNTAACTVKYRGNTYDTNKSFDISSGDLVTVGCDRAEQPLVSMNHKANYLRYKEGVVTVSTQSEGIAIPLIEVTRTISPDSRIDNIESDIQAISKTQGDLSGRLNQTDGRIGSDEATIAKDEQREAKDIKDRDDILLDGHALFHIVSAETGGCLGNHLNTILGGHDQATSQTCAAKQNVQNWSIVLQRGGQ